MTVTSPAPGQIRIKVKYTDTPTRNETAVCTWKLFTSVGETFSSIFKVGTTTPQANSYDRDTPPDDDLNPLENRVEVIRVGGFNPGDHITVRCVLVNLTGTSIADTVNVFV